jgi:hypothetical protein
LFLKLKNSLLIFFFLFFLFQLNAQKKDSLSPVADSAQLAKEIKKENYFAPRRASILSALLPGLGQAYNKKYWKIPIIYAGLGGFGYMFAFNNTEYNYYRKNLIAVNDEDAGTTNETTYNSEQLQTLKNEYKKSRDIAIIGMAVIYFLNIIDANVDAHLKTFDVNDDLSIHLDPWQSVYQRQNSFGVASGLSLKINFK